MPNDNPYWLGHRSRLRDKARSVGVEALRPYEIAELILYQADPRSDMSGLARALINRFGTIRALLSASREELMSVEGMKRPAAEWILRTGRLVDRFTDDAAAPHLRLWRLADMERFIDPIWQDVPAPQTWMLYTDFDDRLLMRSVLCESLAWADPAIAQGVLREAIALQARRAFLVCFTGPEPPELTPNERDYLVRLADTLRAVGVELLDCLLVSEAGMRSLNKSGQMDEVRMASDNVSLHERYVEEAYSCTELPDS